VFRILCQSEKIDFNIRLGRETVVHIHPLLAVTCIFQNINAHPKKGHLIDLVDICFGGSATAFPAFKVSAQKDLF
jgi:hypothetical protein